MHYKWALKILYEDYNSLFDDILAEGGSFNIHDYGLQQIFTGMFKVKMNLWREFLTLYTPHIFLQMNWDLSPKTFELLGILAVSKKWSYILSELKECTSLNEFTVIIKTWKP